MAGECPARDRVTKPGNNRPRAAERGRGVCCCARPRLPQRGRVLRKTGL